MRIGVMNDYDLSDCNYADQLYGFGQTDQQAKQVTSGVFNAFSMFALAGAAVQGTLAYILLSKAGKWEGAWKPIGYIGGTLFALGALGGLGAAAIGQAAKSVTNKVIDQNPRMAPMPTMNMPTMPAPQIPSGPTSMTTPIDYGPNAPVYGPTQA